MSELKDHLTNLEECGSDGPAAHAAYLLGLLDAHNGEVELATARKVLEVACRAACPSCADSCPAMAAYQVEGSWMHGDRARPWPPIYCSASDLRKDVLALYPELNDPAPVPKPKEESDAHS